MTKVETLAAAVALCEAHGASEELTNGLTELLAPKKGGAPLNIADITVKDEEGNLTHIFDSVLKLWVPLLNEEGEDNFYVKEDTELGYSRFSRAAEKKRKDNEKAYKATKDAVFTDLMAGDIDQESAKTLMDEAAEARKDYAMEDFGTAEKPE